MNWTLFELQVSLSHQSASPYFTEEVLLLTVPISCVPEVVTLVMAFCFALGSPELASLGRADDTTSHDLRSSRERGLGFWTAADSKTGEIVQCPGQCQHQLH